MDDDLSGVLRFTLLLRDVWRAKESSKRCDLLPVRQKWWLGKCLAVLSRMIWTRWLDLCSNNYI
ncbi:MAG: hypothetical protein HYX42_00575 [Polaromonas sp.]|uniref:hypothetical protein n=1 Tax=Polaromonas sp. TaxID=1869339 RepID=UPI0025EEC075|nr:hypothetical protein [Polaromonas sp.]MBI2724722.1 hypothetical protein [Polaromonas sp.]